MNHEFQPPLNPELVEEHYEIAVGILRTFASNTSSFSLRELRAHLSDHNIATPAAKSDLEELVDEMRGDIVDWYANQEPPTVVGWISTVNDRAQRQYTLGVVEHTHEGKRRLHSPVSLVLSRSVERPPVAEATRQISRAAPEAEPLFTGQERAALEIIRAGIDMHKNRVMRPHWIEDSLSKLGYQPEHVHQILRRAEDQGIIFTTTRKSQLYYTTINPGETAAPGPQIAGETRRGRNERPLTDQERDVVHDLLDSLAGSLADDPRPQLLRQLVGKYQGKVSKPGMRHLLRALEDNRMITTFVAQGVRQNAAQRVKIAPDARDTWLRDRETALRAIRELRVKA